MEVALTGRAVRTRALPLLAVVCVVLVAGDLGASVALGAVSTAPVLVGLQLVAMLALVVAALRAARAGDDGLAALLIGVALTGTVNDLLGVVGSAVPFALFARGVLYWAYAALFAHLLVRWPDARVHERQTRALLAVLYVVLPLITLVWQTTWDSRWFDGPERGVAWPVLVPARAFSYTVFEVQQLVFLATVVWLLVTIVVRIVRADGRRRRTLVPVGVAGIALAVGVALSLLASLDAAVPVDVDLLQVVAVLAVPLAMLLRSSTSRSDRDDRPDAPVTREERRWSDLLTLVLASAVIATIAVVVSVRDSGAVEGGGPRPSPAPGPPLPVSTG